MTALDPNPDFDIKSITIAEATSGKITVSAETINRTGVSWWSYNRTDAIQQAQAFLERLEGGTAGETQADYTPVAQAWDITSVNISHSARSQKYSITGRKTNRKGVSWGGTDRTTALLRFNQFMDRLVGGNPPPPPDTEPIPVNTVPPEITGTMSEDSVLSVDTGTWDNNPTSFVYQWKRCAADGTNPVSISGQTSNHHTLVTADVGHTIRCNVVATNATGAGTAAQSDPTDVIAAAPAPAVLVPVNSTLPTIAGTAKEGLTLSATPGTWTNSPVSYSYQWKRGVTNIGTNAASYTCVTADVGSTITVVVTAHNAAGDSSPATSAATAAVAALLLSPANTVLPIVTGVAQQGQTLRVNNGTWSNNPTGYGYQWKRGSTDITGATANSYLLAAADVGSTIKCVVTATNPTGSASATSASTSTVTAAPTAPINTAIPTISGTKTEGQTLTADPGTWSGSPTGFGYRWRRCNASGAACLDIPAATAPGYKLTAADVGTTIGVDVTATNGVGSTVASSAKTSLIFAQVAGDEYPGKTKHFNGGAGTSIDAFLATLVPGDVVGLSGICIINTFKFKTGGASDRKIYVTSDNWAAPATLKFPAGGATQWDIRDTCGWFVFDFLIIDDQQSAQPTTLACTGHDILFQRLRVTNHQHHIGMDLAWTDGYGRALRCGINRCEVYDIGPGVYDNRSHDVYNSGIDCWVKHSILRKASARSIQDRGATNGVYDYNLCVESRVGIIVGDLGGSNGLRGTKNIFYNNEYSQIRTYANSGGNDILTDNIVWGLQDGSLENLSNLNSKHIDPNFVNPSTHDYTIQNPLAAGYGPQYKVGPVL